MTNIKFLNEGDLSSGDVLLCSSSLTSEKADEITESVYSHAAIYLEDGEIAEASGSGVRTTSVSELLDEYEYIAVLRKSCVWNDTRFVKLKAFITSLIQDKAKFNKVGIKKFKNRKGKHASSVRNQLEEYYSGSLPSVEHKKDVYFCSDLVVCSFIAVGILEQSAAVVINPGITSPGDIAKESSTFGWFLGYIKSSDAVNIPTKDDFYDQQPFDL